MADDGFNGSTITFEEDQTPLVAMAYDAGCGLADVTGAADSAHSFEPGVPGESIEWEIVGTTTLAIGNEAATTVAWNDGGTLGSFTNAVIVSVRAGGGEDGAKTTVIKARPTAA